MIKNPHPKNLHDLGFHVCVTHPVPAEMLFIDNAKPDSDVTVINNASTPYKRFRRAAWNCFVFKNIDTGFEIVVGKDWSVERCIESIKKQEAASANNKS
jgi:hypothetical protein